MKSIDTYSSSLAIEMTLKKLKSLMRDFGSSRLYYKVLAANDNSKNQIYLGGDFSSLNKIPTGNTQQVTSTSKKKTLENKKEPTIFHAPVNFSWIGPDSTLYISPNANLILYPQYPEVRLSGFLKSSNVNISNWMDPNKEGRSLDRVLFMGITKEGKVLGYLATPSSTLSKEILKLKIDSPSTILQEVSLESNTNLQNKSMLIEQLKRIHQKGWINSKRLNGSGEILECKSMNCGGYTLEAEFGINPNGYSQPDYKGWELKQYGVENFNFIDSKVVTLMTPEPTGGLYKEEGVIKFLHKFGYKDTRGRPDRINFGGLHRCNILHPRTELTLKLSGYDVESNQIKNADGGLVLETQHGEIAAKWHFSNLIDHWKIKHNNAVYIPSQSQSKEGIQYFYSNVVKLGEGTDFIKFLKAVSKGNVYYDPGIKMEKVSSPNPKTKRRSQFRIKTGDLDNLYYSFSRMDVNTTTLL